MANYVVRQGDCFASIAAHYGISTDALAAMGTNSRYREDGRNEYTLNPGDIVTVPDQPPNRSTSFSSGGSVTYRVPIPQVRLRVRMKDRTDAALASKRYELVLGSGRRTTTISGTTDGDGWVAEWIPARTTEALLKLWVDDAKPPYELPLAIGALTDIRTNNGVSQRLHNLGLGLASGDEGRSRAVVCFQRQEGITANGTVDDTLRQHLDERSRGVNRPASTT